LKSWRVIGEIIFTEINRDHGFLHIVMIT